MNRILIFLFVASLSNIAASQSLPVGFPSLEERLRRNQLINGANSDISFAVKPISYQKAAGSSVDSLGFSKPIINSKDGELLLLPFQIIQEYISHHPYPINNGSMIPTKGVQSLFSPGIAGQFNFISFQVKPELIYAHNPSYPGFPEVDESLWPNHRRWPNMYQWWNQADLPEQFGDEPYKKVLPGQSYVYLNFKKISLGFSTQNLWWGPGKYSSLLLTNNSQGFSHLSFHSNTPIMTKAGSLEFQMIAGKLVGSGFVPPDTSRISGNLQLYQPKIDDWRYLNGISMSFQPKWFEGLHVGLSSVVMQYSTTAKENNDYLPIVTNIFRSRNHFSDSIVDRRMSSIFLRWALRNAEIYFEYGRNTGSWNWKDLTSSPQLKSGYVIGFSKLTPLEKKGHYLEVNIELTKLQQPPDFVIASSQLVSWYIDESVRHGYTNNGQVLGSRVGPGGNSQTLELNWIKDQSKVGLSLERLVHNNDFAYFTFHGSRGGEFGSFWVDYKIGLISSITIPKLLLTGQLNYIRTLNYQWEKTPGSPFFEKGVGNDINRFNLVLNAAYLF